MSWSELTTGERVFLFLPDGSSCGAYVKFFDGERLTVEAPDIPSTSFPMIEDELDLQWFRSRGRLEIRVVLTGFYDADGRHWWELETVTEPVLRQERRYVRGPGGQPASLVRQNGEQLTGRLMDIAEASVRVRFTDGHPKVKERVAVSFGLTGRTVAATGTVYRTSPANDSGVDVVLMLEVSRQQADTLRAYIFEQQREQLRTAAG